MTLFAPDYAERGLNISKENIKMEETLIVCVECESEYSIITHHSDSEPAFCPFCGSLNEELEDD